MNDKVKPRKESLAQRLARLSKDELVQRDVLGRTILHIIVLCNRYDLLRHLLKNPQIKHILLLIDYESGWNVLHYMVFYRRMRCLKCLQEYLKTDISGSIFADLLRCKDRSRLTPMQLMHNNFKDLVLVPTCINEKNEFELAKRVRHRLMHEDTMSWWSDQRGGSEVYVLGANSNNNLGVGDSSDRLAPTRLSHKLFKSSAQDEDDEDDHSIQRSIEMPRYKEFLVSKYHSVVVTRSQHIYTCGIGSYGRLGHSRANLSNQYKFKKVLDDLGWELKVDKVAISNNHTLILTCSGQIYGWGANNYGQLGNSFGREKGSLVDLPDAYEATPIFINTGELKARRDSFRGLAVSKIHSLVYTDYEVYSWGLSIGQMGFPVDSSHTIDFRYKDKAYKGQFQTKPKSISFRDQIKLVATCETCTCVITVQNDIHILANYQHIKLPKIPVKVSSEKHFDFFKPAVLTRARKIVKVCFRDEGFIALLMDSGDILGFSLSKDPRNTKYSSVWKPYNEDMNVVDMDTSHDGSIVLCTRDGSVFRKNNGSKLRQNSISGIAPSFINTVTNNKFKRIDSVNKVVKVSCDPNFTSFGFICDSIDALPFKLQLNDFFLDLAYLSCTSMVSETRKQDELFESDESDDFYVTDFIYPSKILPEDGVNNNGLTNLKSEDILLSKFRAKYDYKKNVPVLPLATYKSITGVSGSQSAIVSADFQYWKETFDRSNFASNKCYDCFIEFREFPDIRIGAHKSILQVRSKIFNRLILGDCHLFDNGQIRLTYDSDASVLRFESQVKLQTFLMFMYFIYTHQIVEEPDTTYLNLEEFNAIRKEVIKLSQIFQIGVNSSVSSRLNFQSQFGEALLNSEGKDLLVKLSDGEIMCHSYILVCRSAYFETLFSLRWNDETKELVLENVSQLQFDIVLRHLYGVCDKELFNAYQSSFGSSFEFANFLLEVTEIADQLLLLPLKNLCELAIKDMISLDNVLVLAIHSENLKAKKLFLSCSWFIYNNLELLIFELSEFSYDLIEKLEEQFAFLSNCRKSAIELDGKGHIEEWFEKNALNMVSLFVNDSRLFKEHFMSDKKGYLSFEPLIDIKFDAKTNPADILNKKRKSRKSSVRSMLSTASALKELRNSLADDLVFETRQNGLAESAIVDNEFETVVYGRRKSSLKTTASNLRQSSPPAQTIGLSSAVASSMPMSTTTSTVSISLTGSSTTAIPTNQKDYDRFPSLTMAWKNGSTLSLGSVSSPYGSATETSNGSAIEEQNGQSVARDVKPTSNKKVLLKPIVRLSQKQRKKLAQEAGEENVAMASTSGITSKLQATPVPPWMASNTKETEIPAKAESTSLSQTVSQRKLSQDLASLPVLGAPKSREPSQPTLTEIMLEESLKNELKPEPVQKTFLEIQQEEEFNKWWQAEAAKVQREMGLLLEPKKKKAVPKKNKKVSDGSPSLSLSHNKANSELGQKKGKSSGDKTSTQKRKGKKQNTN